MAELEPEDNVTTHSRKPLGVNVKYVSVKRGPYAPVGSISVLSTSMLISGLCCPCSLGNVWEALQACRALPKPLALLNGQASNGKDAGQLLLDGLANAACIESR